MPDPTAFQNLGTTDEAEVVKDVLRLDNSPGGVLLPSRGWALQGWTVKTLDGSGLLTWDGERSIQVLGFADANLDALETILNNFDPTDGQLLTLTTDSVSEIDVRDLGVIGGSSKQILMRGENAHCLLSGLRVQLHLRWDSDADQWREQSRSQSVKRRVWIPESALRSVGTPLVGTTIGTTPTVTAIRLNSTDDGAIGQWARPPDYADATSVTLGVSLALAVAGSAPDVLRMVADYITSIFASSARSINHTSTQILGSVVMGGFFGGAALYEVRFAALAVADANNPLTTWETLTLEARLDAASDVSQANVLGMFLEYSPVV